MNGWRSGGGDEWVAWGLILRLGPLRALAAFGRRGSHRPPAAARVRATVGVGGGDRGGGAVPLTRPAAHRGVGCAGLSFRPVPSPALRCFFLCRAPSAHF